MDLDNCLNILKFCAIDSHVSLSQTNSFFHLMFLFQIKLQLLIDFRKYLNHVSLNISKPLIKIFKKFWITGSLHSKMNFWNFWQANKKYYGNCFDKMKLLMIVLQFIDQKYDDLMKLKNDDKFQICCRAFDIFIQKLHQICPSNVKNYIYNDYHFQNILIFLKPDELQLRCESILKIFPQISDINKIWEDLNQITAVLCHLLCGRADQIEGSIFGEIFWYSYYPPRVSYCIDTVAPFLLLGSKNEIVKRLSLHLPTLENHLKLFDEDRNQNTNRNNILSTTCDAFYFYLDKSYPDDITLIQRDNIHDIIDQFMLRYHKKIT